MSMHNTITLKDISDTMLKVRVSLSNPQFFTKSTERVYKIKQMYHIPTSQNEKANPQNDQANPKRKPTLMVNQAPPYN